MKDKFTIYHYTKGDVEVAKKDYKLFEEFEEYWWKLVEEHERYYFVDDALAEVFFWLKERINERTTKKR